MTESDGIRTVETPDLAIGYRQWNPGGTATAVLLHGWPDSPACWRSVAGQLAQAGYRVLAPALRGFAPTRFLRPETARSGQLAALGTDLLAFIDALGLQHPVLVGHDWGARAAANACGLRPGVASHLVMLSVGYATNHPGQVLTLEQARNYWYHWFMATPRGERTVRDDRRSFARMMWQTWSPPGWFDEADFQEAAIAFDDPDWVDVVLHSYRHRWGHAAGDPSFAAAEALLDPAPRLSVPTLVIHGGADYCNHPDTSSGREPYFTGRDDRRVLPGVGHFPPREAPDAVAAAILGFCGTG